MKNINNVTKYEPSNLSHWDNATEELEVRNWRQLAKDHAGWRGMLIEAEVDSGLWRHKKKKKKRTKYKFYSHVEGFVSFQRQTKTQVCVLTGINGSQMLYRINSTKRVPQQCLRVFGEKDITSPADYDAENLDTSTVQPVFDFGMPRNISARTGQTALIKCHVDNLGDKSISWIRKRDLHILTVGSLTYTSDERFQVTQTEDSKEWTLQVKFPQPRDSGIYECQVNTEPKISMAFQLNVIVTPPHAKAVIAGRADLHFKVGSSIILTCIVKQPIISTKLTGQIVWYRGEDVITPFHLYHPNEASVDLTKRISMESQLGDTLKSRLRISNAQTTDTGNYTCSPTTASSASVMVHVINDENPAAMQKSGTRSNGSTEWLPSACVATTLALIELIIHLMV